MLKVDGRRKQVKSIYTLSWRPDVNGLVLRKSQRADGTFTYRPEISSQFSRRDQDVYNRLKIGHSYPTHSYLLHKEPQPLCIPCYSPFSIEHVLTECIDFQPTRINYYPTSDISQLFHKVHPSSTPLNSNQPTFQLLAIDAIAKAIRIVFILPRALKTSPSERLPVVMALLQFWCALVLYHAL